ncbi:MAG: DUF6728 family protein [Ekhidna sp.]
MEDLQNKEDETKTNYFDFTEVLTYFFRKKDPNRPKNFTIGAMHIINKISMSMFLAAIIFLIVRSILRN